MSSNFNLDDLRRLKKKETSEQSLIFLPSISCYQRVLREASIQERVFLEIMFHCLAVEQEVREITWNDIDIDNHQIRLDSNKHDRNNGWIPMTSALSQELFECKEFGMFDTDNEYLFKVDGVATVFVNHDDLKELRDRAEVNYFKLEHVRAIAARAMYVTNGIHVQDICWMLGHDHVGETVAFLRRLRVAKNPVEYVYIENYLY